MNDSPRKPPPQTLSLTQTADASFPSPPPPLTMTPTMTARSLPSPTSPWTQLPPWPCPWSARRLVHVIAPSFIGQPSNVAAYEEFVRGCGMAARVANAMYDPGADPFYANADRYRSNDLADALTDDSAVVWCARGGSGASRLIPYLDALPADRKQSIRDARKVLVGFSDITTLHVYLHAAYGWQTIHGAMLEQIVGGTVDARSVDKLVALVTGRANRVRYELLRVPGCGGGGGGGADITTTTPLTSKVTGGNLTLVENTLGTAYAFNGAGKIVFLEDVDVKPYAVERSLDHMKQARVFDGTAAVVFGTFLRRNPEPDDDSLFELVFGRFAGTVPFPVFRVHGIGHGFVNDPLPLNTNATVTTDGPAAYALTVDGVYL